jgi:hypothetical protein
MSARRIRLPKTAALLAEALAVDVETVGGVQRTVDLSGRILGTDAGATRLFAVKVRRARSLEPEAISRARGVRARAVRQSWQGQRLEQWIEIQTALPRRAIYLGTARRIYYRSDKLGRRRQAYVHEFSKPAPAVYRAQGNYFILGGKKRITPRGIEG